MPVLQVTNVTKLYLVTNFFSRAFKNPGFPPAQFSLAVGKKIKDRSRLDFFEKKRQNCALNSYLLRVVLFDEQRPTKYAADSSALRASFVPL